MDEPELMREERKGDNVPPAFLDSFQEVPARPKGIVGTSAYTIPVSIQRRDG